MPRPQVSDLGWTKRGTVKPATAADIRRIEANLRAEDRRELEEIAGKPALQSLFLGALAGDPCVTLWSLDGTPLAVLSVVRTGRSQGAIALSGTRDIERFSSAFLRGSRDILAVLHREYDLLFNVCDARNTVHRKWLRWLGFTEIAERDGYGAAKVPVVEFAKLKGETPFVTP